MKGPVMAFATGASLSAVIIILITGPNAFLVPWCIMNTVVLGIGISGVLKFYDED
jgi:hypothetical protein